jgi:tetratricopeptide (TPR) repeat protein
MSDAELTRKEAKRAYKVKDFAAAADLYAGLLDRPAASPQAVAADRTGYASALIGLNRLDDAAVQYGHVIALTPVDAKARHKFGEILARLDRHDEAADQLAEAARLEPRNADHPFRLAVELHALGRDEESAAALQQCLSLNPKHTEAQIFQLEQSLVLSPERDALFELLKPPQPPQPIAFLLPRALRIRQSGPMIAMEALLITGAALWLRSLFP